MRELYQTVNQSFQALSGKKFSWEDFFVVCRTMKGANRFYHGPTHLQKMTIISKYEKEILCKLPVTHPDKMCHSATLAGFFHDAVYVTIDKGMSREIQDILNPVVVQTPQGWCLRAGELTQGIKDIFSVPQDGVLPMSCQNEALSAVLAGQILQKNGLGYMDILSIVSMIEATVPFQSIETIAHKAIQRENIFGKQTPETMYGGIYLGNKDVSGFGELDTSIVTLKQKLLSNAVLVGKELFPGLRRTNPSREDKIAGAEHNVRFWRYLLENETYRQIFHQYQNYPRDGQIKILTKQAEKLIRHGLKVHGAQLSRLTRGRG